MKRLKLLTLVGLGMLTLLAPSTWTSAVDAAAGCTLTVLNINDSGSGSLRQAIIDANNNGSSVDTICFNISTGHAQIIPSSALPPIINPIIIDGTTQAGFNSITYQPLIEISGNRVPIASDAYGLRITGNGAGSTIKGLIINRFPSNGIFLDSGNNTIIDNYIGLSSDGTAGAGNIGDGIGIFSGISTVNASNNTIGGTTIDKRNVVSGNGAANPNGANGIGITADNGGTANNNTISGNYIGTSADGTVAIANNADGILVNDAGNGTLVGNSVGGTNGTTPNGACAGSCNLISGNRANGVGFWNSGVTSSTTSGNYIGLKKDGMSALPNGNIGVELEDTANNTVGATSATGRNIISGNLGAGIFIDGSLATGNTVVGNYIGPNTLGTNPVANLKMGISIGYTPGGLSAHNNNIGSTTGTTTGGSCTGGCNLISGNGQNGILVAGPGSNHFLSNYIGTDVVGTGNIRNSGDGIGLSDSPNNIIGDGSAAGGNVISANGDNGIIIVGTGSTGNRIQANYIGEGADAGSLGNAGDGILLVSGISNAFLGNRIGYNVKLGIDLNQDGVSQNDLNDIDGGANNTQNYPNLFGAITQIISGTTATKIGGFFNSNPNSSYRLEFFTSNGCNAGAPNNFGQGQVYIGSTDVTTDQFGNTSFGFTPQSPAAGQKYITATATRKINGTPAETSEFSQCILVNVAKPALTNGATWFLKYDLTNGPADKTFGYGFPTSFLMCAWDPDQLGVKLPVIFSGGTWFMRASYTTGKSDLTFNYGSSNARPVCGDWNGDGVDTVGVVDSGGNWYLRNSNSSGIPDAGSFQFGTPGATPVVGDWDGNGTDTIGTVDNGNNWVLRNSNSAGAPDSSFNYGFTPGYSVVGDWDGNGTDTIGSVSTSGTWALRNSNSGGSADSTFQYGFPGAVPIIW